MKCEKCQFSYLPKSEEDNSRHKRYHRHFVKGVPLQDFGDLKFLRINHENRLVVIDQMESKSIRTIPEPLAVQSMYETGFSGLPYSSSEPIDERNVHSFLLCFQHDAIGLLVMEKSKNIWLTNWDDIALGKADKISIEEPVWSISMVWMAYDYRNQGNARLLVRSGLRYLEVSIDQIAWFQPFTPQGRKFIKSLAPKEVLITR